MKLAVFGANGGTGRPLVAQAHERGHAVTSFVRSSPKGDSLVGVDRVVTGDARNITAVGSALRDVDAVISAMGPKGPQPGTTYSEAIGTLVRAMEATDVGRVVISANSRVLDERPLDGAYAGVSQEHRDALLGVRASGLAWTVVSTSMLADDEPTGAYEAVIGAPAPGRSIPRADFATALLDALDHPEWSGLVVDVAGAP